MARGGARVLSWSELFDQWPLIEAGFHDVFTVDLEEVWHRKSWRWFRTRLDYLIGVDSALARHLRAHDDEHDE